MVLDWPVFKNSVSLVGLRYNAQDDLHSQGQHLIILQSDRGWGNSLLDTRYSEHAGPRVSNKFVKWLPISPEPNMSRGDLVTAKFCLRPRGCSNVSQAEAVLGKVDPNPSRPR